MSDKCTITIFGILIVCNVIAYVQEAVAIGCELELGRIGHPDCYFQTLPQELEPKRDRLAKILQDVGMTPIIPEGGYFMIADYTKLGNNCYFMIVGYSKLSNNCFFMIAEYT